MAAVPARPETPHGSLHLVVARENSALKMKTTVGGKALLSAATDSL